MKSRLIALVTLALMIASIWGFIAVLTTYGSTPWALPTYIAVVVVIGVTGAALAWRTRDR
jgi:hypothetical protein